MGTCCCVVHFLLFLSSVSRMQLLKEKENYFCRRTTQTAFVNHNLVHSGIIVITTPLTFDFFFLIPSVL